MSTPVPTDPESEPSTAAPLPAETPHGAHPDAHLDPITGEPHAHPVGVGVGAMGAGAVGAAIGAFLGPIGIVAGAAIGAIAGGLAGKEVAEEPEISPTETEGNVPLDEFDHASGSTTDEEVPLSSSLAARTEPADDAFFTGGTVSGSDPEVASDRLDEFDRPHAAASAAVPATESVTSTTAAPAMGVFDEDEPLPTASSGLITPEESSFFADSTTGESSVLTESPLPAARAVNAEGTSELADDTSSYAIHSDSEHTVRLAAYYRYLGREVTHEPGTDFEDWIKAEREVLQR